MILAAISVVISFAMGQVARGMFHDQRWRQGVTAFVLLVYFVLLTTYHLTIAHLRLALDGDAPEQAHITAIERMLSTPFEIVSFESWLLLIVGIGFALAALVAGLYTTDPFPGLGRRFQRQRDAADTAHERWLDFVRALIQVSDPQLARARQLLSEVQRAIAQFETNILRKEVLLRQYERQVGRLNDSLQYSIALYRTCNREQRLGRKHGEEVPAYFDQAVERPFDPQALLIPAKDRLDLDRAMQVDAQVKVEWLRDRVYAIQQQILAMRQAAAKDTMDASSVSLVLSPRRAQTG